MSRLVSEQTHRLTPTELFDKVRDHMANEKPILVCLGENTPCNCGHETCVGVGFESYIFLRFATDEHISMLVEDIFMTYPHLKMQFLESLLKEEPDDGT